jgi:hypothetical protein
MAKCPTRLADRPVADSSGRPVGEVFGREPSEPHAVTVRPDGPVSAPLI